MKQVIGETGLTMNTDEYPSASPSSPMPGMSNGFRFGLFGNLGDPSLVGHMLGRLRKDIHGFLAHGVRTGARSVQHAHDETTFRFLLTNEAKRSERSGRSFHILLTYFSDREGSVTRMGGEATQMLLPILSAVLRETDYIGWYRNSHILGGVLTALGDHTTDAVSCRIEQRFWRRIERALPAKEFPRLRVRSFHAQEFVRIGSTELSTALG